MKGAASTRYQGCRVGRQRSRAQAARKILRRRSGTVSQTAARHTASTTAATTGAAPSARVRSSAVRASLKWKSRPNVSSTANQDLRASQNGRKAASGARAAQTRGRFTTSHIPAAPKPMKPRHNSTAMGISTMTDSIVTMTRDVENAPGDLAADDALLALDEAGVAIGAVLALALLEGWLRRRVPAQAGQVCEIICLAIFSR